MDEMRIGLILKLRIFDLIKINISMQNQLIKFGLLVLWVSLSILISHILFDLVSKLSDLGKHLSEPQIVLTSIHVCETLNLIYWSNLVVG